MAKKTPGASEDQAERPHEPRTDARVAEDAASRGRPGIQGTVMHETTVSGKPVQIVRDDLQRVWLCGISEKPTLVASVEMAKAVLEQQPR